MGLLHETDSVKTHLTEYGWNKIEIYNIDSSRKCFAHYSDYKVDRPLQKHTSEFSFIFVVKFCHQFFICKFYSKMLEFLYNIPFHVLEPPNLKIKRISVPIPSAKTIFCLVLLSYFLVTGGIIYDVIIEPPSIGSTVDANGHSKPVAFLPYRVNGQYIMEGLASSFLFTIGGIGFILLDQTTDGKPKLNKLLLTSIGFLFVLVSFFTTFIFMRMKLPGYLQP